MSRVLPRGTKISPDLHTFDWKCLQLKRQNKVSWNSTLSESQAACTAMMVHLLLFVGLTLDKAEISLNMKVKVGLAIKTVWINITLWAARLKSTTAMQRTIRGQRWGAIE